MSDWTILFFLLLTGTQVPPAAGKTENDTEKIQSEEHQNISLYMVSPDKPPDRMYVDLIVKSRIMIYRYNSRREAEPYTNESYKGRLHCDPRLTRNGRIECLLKDLRLNDTGMYQMVVYTDGKSAFKKYELSVSARTTHEFQPQTETEPPGWRRYGPFASLALFLLVLVCLCVNAYCKKRSHNSSLLPHMVNQPIVKQ